MKTLHVNLWAGPGVGKSTISSHIFAKLKWNMIDCEIISEYAKQLVWEKTLTKLQNPIYVFAKQYNKHYVLDGQVEVVISDSPFPLISIYNDNDDLLHNLIMDRFNQYDNLNILLKREKHYNPNGRLQTLEQAKQKDVEIQQFLKDNKIDYIEISANQENVDQLVDLIIEKIK